ncbi:MAG: hypothetical protein H7101_10965 [Deinococcales bacterium]|nr:hypothetical protein [Chitinophagaceae bacterium]
MKILLFIVTMFVLPLNNYAQEKKVSLVVNQFYREITTLLTPYEIGSGFTIIVFRFQETGKYKKISTTSSNFKTKAIFENFIDSTHSFFELKNARPGFYALPVIQIMYDDNKIKELNWANNSSWEMANFEKKFNLPENTILLKPIVITGSPPINKKVN